MKTLVLLCATVAIALSNTVSVKRIPSKIEQWIADGSWPARYQQLDESEPLIDYYNTYYLSQFLIGTPPQNFTVQLDTGSSDLWVAGNKCTFCIGMTKFNPSASSTYKDLGGSWAIQYGSGACRGTKGQDVVQFDGTDYKYNSQIFGLATQLNPEQFQHMDGICGMAYQSISSIKTPDPWANIITGGTPMPPHPWFTVWLEELKGEPMAQKGGAFTFGDNDNSHCSSSCNWVPISNQLWYEIKIDGVGAGSYMSSSTKGISDTGTSFLIGPVTDIDNIGKQLGGKYDFSQGLWSIACSKSSASGPTLDVKLNGNTYSVSPKNYIVDLGGGQCFLAMQGANIGNPPWILGDTFIREWCNMYDMKNNRLGLCKAN